MCSLPCVHTFMHIYTHMNQPRANTSTYIYTCIYINVHTHTHIFRKLNFFEENVTDNRPKVTEMEGNQGKRDACEGDWRH